MKHLPSTLLYSFLSVGILTPNQNAHAFEAVVQAKGQIQRVLVNGSDGREGDNGRDGRDGADGRDGYCRDREHSDNGQDGEDGENGYDGERGRDGESGGDVLVQYEDLKNLKAIYIESVGGEGGHGGVGGRGGRGGRGGWGCNGGRHGRDGSWGRDGSNGGSGSDGGYGTLYIKAGFAPYVPSLLNNTVSLAQFFKTPTIIRKNFWEEKIGSAGLIAPGSSLSGHYQEFISTKIITTTGVLTSDQKLSPEILSQRLTVRFNDTFTEPVIDFQDSRIIVFLSREAVGEDSYLYKIDSIYNSDDFFHFRAGIRGQIGQDRRILISDLKSNWKELSTTLAVRVQDRSSWKSFSIPSSAIRLSPYGPEIMIAKVKGLSAYEGQSLKAEVVMSRNLKGRILVRSFTVKDGL